MAKFGFFKFSRTGSLQDGQVWAVVQGEGPGVADGMTIDALGNLYCCGPGGIHVFDPSGARVGIIRLPEQTANLCWGDEDSRSLYITASNTLYHLRVNRALGLSYPSPLSCQNDERRWLMIMIM